MKTLVLLTVFASACGQTPAQEPHVTAVSLAPSQANADANGDPVQDLPLGEVSSDLTTNNWGSALTCKTLPTLQPLVAPRVILSIEGLTVHLIDEATGYDRVFAAGVGKIDADESQTTFGESLSYYPLIATKSSEFKFRRTSNVACKTWWTDPETGKKSPVFAGLPFMPFYGGYAIHGPIDNFTAANGGALTRGFVSHGCFRMQAADISEIYARIGTLAEVPVHLQREPERLSDGTRTDTDRFVGSECASDLDCGFAGGFCHANSVGERGFCTARCDRSCADRPSSPTTFCVPDPDASGQGMCVVKVSPRNQSCRPYDHLQAKTLGRNGQPSVTASVCVPGTRGWIGDHCRVNSDCQSGGLCQASVCTMACSRACPDQTGTPWTTCVAEASLGGTACARQCTVATNASECAANTACVDRPRASDPSATKSVCVPD